MTYYDHATAMAFKLDRWSKGRNPQSHERRAIACAQRQADQIAQEPMASKRRSFDQGDVKTSVYMRCAALFRSIKFKDTLDAP